MKILNGRQLQWSKRYRAALDRHIKQRRGTSLEPALVLGRYCVTLGLETLDIAGIHEKVMLSIAEKNGPLKAIDISRAKKFFLETIVPIEETHLAALETGRLVKTATEALRRRTRETSDAARRLERGITKRKTAESVLKESGGQLSKLLHESCHVQSQLRQKTRNKLLMQEGTNREVSRQLQNELAQTLLAIHLRLLTLKISNKSSMDRLKKEIAANQTLVRQSGLTIKRLKNEIERHYEK